MLRPATPTPTLPPDVPRAVLTRHDLIRAGATARDLARAVSVGVLRRPRRGRYLPRDTNPDVVEAVRCGGRLDCVSLLRVLSVFVLDLDGLHLQLEPDTTRVPSPAHPAVRHWRRSAAEVHATTTPVVEAIVRAVLCQPPRAAIATLDSAWHLGLVDEVGIGDVFARLPRRYQRLRGLLDPRAGSGIETLVRLMLRSLGYHAELQVEIVGAGFVDLVVDGWLVIECDSTAHHSTWTSHKNDRRRDAAAVAQGYVSLRLLADDVLHRPEWVMDVLRRTLSHGPVHNSGAGRATTRKSRRRARNTPSVPEL